MLVNGSCKLQVLTKYEEIDFSITSHTLEDFMAEVENDPDAIEEICMRHNIFPISQLEYNR